MGPTVEVEWNGRRVEAAAPHPIASSELELGPSTARKTERAAAAVQRAGAQAGAGREVAARLLLRSEGLASSAIEGLHASPAEVALAEAAGPPGPGDRHAGHELDVAAWVADNLAVVADALAAPGPLDGSMLFAWHSRLMRSAIGMDARHVGAYRDVLGWVGGPNPLLAAHVAAPADRVAPLMADLFAYVARDDVDPVTQAAVAHAQFETIHPFADGNGRLGRVLIGRILCAGLDVTVPPPVSLRFSRDIGGYLAGLALFRQGLVEQWVSWFADAVEAAADRSSAVLAAVGDIQHRWAAEIEHLRADAAARRIVLLLPAHPIVSAASVAGLLGVSNQAARTGLDALVAHGVLDPFAPAHVGRGRPRNWYAATDLLDLLGR